MADEEKPTEGAQEKQATPEEAPAPAPAEAPKEEEKPAEPEPAPAEAPKEEEKEEEKQEEKEEEKQEEKEEEAPAEEAPREITPPPQPATPEAIASAPSGIQEGTLSADQRKGLVLLFGKWDFSEVTVRDPGLVRYVNVRPIAVPHTSGRHANKSFAKQRLNIVERLINGMMRTEHSTGEKAHAYHVVEEAFDIVANRTKKNPIQVFVDALQMAAPREEVTRLRFGGISVPKAVDVSASRRLDVALRNMCNGVVAASHRKKKRLPQCLADEIMNAAEGKLESAAMAKREEVERVAASAR